MSTGQALCIHVTARPPRVISFGITLKPVVTLRPVRGNLATKHDRSPAQLEKTLRRQFGSFYDQKKIGNHYSVARIASRVVRLAAAIPRRMALNVPSRSGL